MELTYDEFYEKYYKLIKSVVYKYNFRSSKEDVLQDIMIDIWKNYETIKNNHGNSEKKEAYVYAIAKYRCNYYLRREHESGLWLCNSNEYIERFSSNSMIYNIETDTRNGKTIVLDDYVKEYRKRRNKYSKEYYQKNKEKRLAYSRKYRSKHKEKAKAYNKEYHKKNKEKEKEYAKKYYQEHKEELIQKRKEYNKKYREEHKEELAAYQKEWRKRKKEEKLNGKTS